MLIIIVFVLGSDMPSELLVLLLLLCFFPYPRLSSCFLIMLICLNSFLLFYCCSHARVLEFHTSYSYTEWY